MFLFLLTDEREVSLHKVVGPQVGTQRAQLFSYIINLSSMKKQKININNLTNIKSHTLNCTSVLSLEFDIFCGAFTSALFSNVLVVASSTVFTTSCSDVCVSEGWVGKGLLWGPRRLRRVRPLYTGFGFLGEGASIFGFLGEGASISTGGGFSSKTGFYRY